MRILALIGALTFVVGVAGGSFSSAALSVAGTQEDLAPVKWAMIQVRTASISHHATDAPPANLGDAATVQAGAKAYGRARLRQLPRRAGHGLGEVFRRAAPRTRPMLRATS